MTDVISGFSLTLPPGNGAITVTTIQCPLGWSSVEKIRLVFPPGCSALVGVAINYAANVVYPVGPTPWFILDEDVAEVDVSNQQEAGQWSLSGYNQDFYQHVVTGYFYWDYLTLAQQQSASSLVSL